MEWLIEIFHSIGNSKIPRFLEFWIYRAMSHGSFTRYEAVIDGK